MVLLYAATLLPPMLVALYHDETQAAAFLRAMLALTAFGALGLLSSRGRIASMQKRDGFLLVVVFWLLFSVCGALPFVFDRGHSLRFVDAMFEAISGITTTGASILSNLDSQPRSIVYYRAQLNFLGGLGIVVIAVALLPLLGIGGARLYRSETPGPLKEERMTPRLVDTAKNLWYIYVSMGISCALAYRAAGVPWFDAVCYSMSTISLGGFSTHDASLGYYDSAAVEIVAGVFSFSPPPTSRCSFARCRHAACAPGCSIRNTVSFCWWRGSWPR
jgi:trk system potassium uptake protein